MSTSWGSCSGVCCGTSAVTTHGPLERRLASVVPEAGTWPLEGLCGGCSLCSGLAFGAVDLGSLSQPVFVGLGQVSDK